MEGPPSSLEAAAIEAAVADGLMNIPGGEAALKAKKSGLRRGKWTLEEEAYANRLIQEFKAGLLPLTDGTTLRTFLSKLLNCDPMRISKKFVGSNCIGKQVFRRRQQDLEKLSLEQIDVSRRELADLERKFLERVAQTNRSKTVSKSGKDDYEGGMGDMAVNPSVYVPSGSVAPWMMPPQALAMSNGIVSHPHPHSSAGMSYGMSHPMGGDMSDHHMSMGMPMSMSNPNVSMNMQGSMSMNPMSSMRGPNSAQLGNMALAMQPGGYYPYNSNSNLGGRSSQSDVSGLSSMQYGNRRDSFSNQDMKSNIETLKSMNNNHSSVSSSMHNHTNHNNNNININNNNNSNNDNMISNLSNEDNDRLSLYQNNFSKQSLEMLSALEDSNFRLPSGHSMDNLAMFGMSANSMFPWSSPMMPPGMSAAVSVTGEWMGNGGIGSVQSRQDELERSISGLSSGNIDKEPGSSSSSSSNTSGHIHQQIKGEASNIHDNKDYGSGKESLDSTGDERSPSSNNNNNNESSHSKLVAHNASHDILSNAPSQSEGSDPNPSPPSHDHENTNTSSSDEHQESKRTKVDVTSGSEGKSEEFSSLGSIDQLARSKALYQQLHGQAGATPVASGSLGSSSKRRFAQMDGSTPAAAGTTGGTQSGVPTGASSAISKKSSIEDFLMLVDMGDLPQPDTNVLSAPLFPNKGTGSATNTITTTTASQASSSNTVNNNNNGNSSSLPAHIQHMQLVQQQYEQQIQQQQQEQQRQMMYSGTNNSNSNNNNSNSESGTNSNSSYTGNVSGSGNHKGNEEDSSSRSRKREQEANKEEQRDNNISGTDSSHLNYEEFIPQSLSSGGNPSNGGETAASAASLMGFHTGNAPGGGGPGAARGMGLPMGMPLGMGVGVPPDMHPFLGMPPWQQQMTMGGFPVPHMSGHPAAAGVGLPGAQASMAGWGAAAMAMQQRQYQQQMYHHYLQQQQQQQWHQQMQQFRPTGSSTSTNGLPFPSGYDLYHSSMGMSGNNPGNNPPTMNGLDSKLQMQLMGNDYSDSDRIIDRTQQPQQNNDSSMENGNRDDVSGNV